MKTTDLIKKMSSSQNVRPPQLTKVVEPERVRVDIVTLQEKESVTDKINQEVKELEKSEEEKKLDRRFNAIDIRYVELQSALELALKDNMVLAGELKVCKTRTDELEKRLKSLEEKTFWQRLFKWR